MIFFRRFPPIMALLLMVSFFYLEPAWGRGAYPFRWPDPKLDFDPKANTVIGMVSEYVVKKKDTLLDVARNYDLGFNEIEALYPEIDPWIPPEGKNLIIPSQWVLPATKKFGIVINIAEMRLYYFLKSIGMVRSYPIGIGDVGWFSPLGTFHVSEKRLKPTWYIPESLQEKYQMKTMPPGPENPLGDHWLGLSIPGYGIHGTNFPWAVGRLVTHGCIRLYPEDIEKLFSTVPVKTPVEMIYEPVKIGFQQGRIYAEVHPDIYGKIPALVDYGLKKVKNEKWADRIDLEQFTKALRETKGLTIDITKN